MDCNCNQWSTGSCRPQMPPPCMNINSGCQGPGTATPLPAVPYRPADQARPMPQASQYSLAMAYVPWQQWRQTYPMEQGFVRGTIFPELDLPFVMGRCR